MPREKNYFEGVREGLHRFPQWKDGIQYAGSAGGTTLKEALIEIAIQEKSYYDHQTAILQHKIVQLRRY